jgi:fatty acid-binding protein DegV
VAIKIVSDSTADIPADLAERLGITVVPAYVLIDDVAYREGVDITREDFYVRLQASPRLPTTLTAYRVGLYTTPRTAG